MIIKSLHASNFMRYDQLTLADLPESGLIAVLGENESGKSTIGECIAFALFGQSIRTSRGGSDINIINWRKPDCEVRLDFMTDTGDTYRVVRQLDRAGTRQAELYKLPGEEPVAKGIAEVEGRLSTLIRFSFEEFRYSFYLAQNELSLLRRGPGDDRQQVIQNMLGITEVEQTLEATRDTLDELLDAREQGLSELSLTDRLTEAYQDDEKILQKTRSTLGDMDAQEREHSEGVSKDRRDAKTAREALQARNRALAAFHDLRDQVTFSFHAGRAAEAFSELRGIRVAMEKARERLKADYIARRREREDLLAREEDARHLREKLERLQEMVALHGAAVKGGLARGGRDMQNRQDYLLSESEREKLSIIEQRIRRRNRRLRRRRLKLGAALGIGFMMLLAGFALYFIEPRPFTFLGQPAGNSRLGGGVLGVAGIGLLILGAWVAVRVQAGGVRLASLLETRKALWDKIDLLKKSLRAAEQFDADDPGVIVAAMDDIKDEGVRNFCRALREQHPAYFKDGARPDPDEMEKKIEQVTASLEQVKETAVHYKHILNVLDRKLPAIEAALEDGRNGSDAEQRKIGNPAQTETRVTELLERSAVSLSIVKSFGEAKQDAAPDPSLVADIANSIDSLRHVSANGGNGRTESLRAYPEQSDLPALVSTHLDMDATQFDASLAKEAALLEKALPPEKELRRLEEEYAERIVDHSSALAAAQARKQTLAESVEAFSPRLEKGKSIRATHADLQERLEQLDRDVEVHHTLIDLLEGTAASMKNRFGPAIAGQMGAILPKITGGRYDRVEVTEELEIKVYSPDKKGLEDPFVHVADLSGGAADQLLVSLRLALSRAMLRAKNVREGSGQFLFFDEPVSSFDAERSSRFIDLLKDFSSTFSQIFIVSHNEEIARNAEQWAQAVIHTSMNSRKLTIA